MSLTFLQIVNEALAESKVQLDPLTSANFADPPRTILYNRFKQWVNSAYKELLMARNEWHFRKERALVTVWPRLHVSGLSTIPAVGDVLIGDSSGVRCTIQSIHTFEDVEGDSTNERTFSVTFDADSDPNNFIMRETFTCDPAVGVDFASGYLKGYGRYDFGDEIPTLQEIDKDTVRIFDTPDHQTVDPLLDRDGAVIYNLPWDKWQLEYELHPWSGPYPIYISETPQGVYDLFPKPSRAFILTFDYTRKITQMSLYDDTPEGIPEEYHEYLIWRAVEEFADFDNNPRLFARAAKHVRDYWNWMDRDQKPEPRLASSKFSGGYIRGGWFT